MFNFLYLSLFFLGQAPFNYKTPPPEYDHHVKFDRNLYSSHNFLFSKASKDHTEELQEFLNSNDTVVLPKGTIYINKQGIKLNSNNVLIGQKESILKIIPNKEIDFAAIHIEDIKDASVLGVHIIGDREERRGEIKGEWGHGITIKNSENVLIQGVKVEKTIGDGVYIGQINSLPSKNVTVKESIIDNVRRNGISITSGIDILLENIFVSNTNGTAPMYGIDIEPNNNRDFIENIKLCNIVTYNNKVGGVLISLNKLGKGTQKRKVDISVSNLKDYYSHTGFYISNITVGVENLRGSINVEDLYLYSNYTPFTFKSSTAKRVKVNIKNIDWEKQYRKAFTKENMINNLRNRKDLKYRK